MSYRQILDDADEHFREVARTQPAQLQCVGCSLCCYGLFEIGAADVAVLADGLAQLTAATRKTVIRRASAIVEADPINLRESTIQEKDAYFHRASSTPCPNLSEEGRCLVYDHRPLLCRTFGVPVRQADRYLGDVCELNFTTATDKEKFEAAWDLNLEDELGPDDECTIPEAILAIAHLRGWRT